VLAPAHRGEEIEQWLGCKGAAAQAILAAGGTITHHHAVGRDHRPWSDAQRPDPFAAALRAAEGAVDPRGILNPGVLIEPALATVSP
jgi:alkyldihydroxyacetonephosphate synthase